MLNKIYIPFLTTMQVSLMNLFFCFILFFRWRIETTFPSFSIPLHSSLLLPNIFFWFGWRDVEVHQQHVWFQHLLRLGDKWQINHPNTFGLSTRYFLSQFFLLATISYMAGLRAWHGLRLPKFKPWFFFAFKRGNYRTQQLEVLKRTNDVIF